MPIVMKKQKGTYGYRTVVYRAASGETLNAFITGTATLGVPTGVTVTPQGTAQTTTYGYRVTAVQGGGAGGTGETTGATEGTTTTGNATLTSGNFNRVTWTGVTGANGYNVYRTTGGATQGKIGFVAAGGTLQFDDTGITAAGALPGSNTGVTFNITVPSLRVAGSGAHLKTGIGVNGSRSATNVIVGGR
jgi:hypothetical protein